MYHMFPWSGRAHSACLRCTAQNARRVLALTFQRGNWSTVALKRHIQGLTGRRKESRAVKVWEGFLWGKPIVQAPEEGLPKTSLKGVYCTLAENWSQRVL